MDLQKNKLKEPVALPAVLLPNYADDVQQAGFDDHPTIQVSPVPRIYLIRNQWHEQ